MLGGKIVLVDMLVVSGILEFNVILGRDYVYTMNVVVSMSFCSMHFPHNGSIVTIYQLSSHNHHHFSTLAQASPLYVPSIQVEFPPP
jgi:hypothetical protein